MSRTICRVLLTGYLGKLGDVMKKSEFHREFIKNTRRLRIKAGFDDAKEFAGFIGIPYANYAKYETRTPLPHYLISKFCKLVRVPVKTLFDVGPKKTKEQLSRHMMAAVS